LRQRFPRPTLLDQVRQKISEPPDILADARFFKRWNIGLPRRQRYDRPRVSARRHHEVHQESAQGFGAVHLLGYCVVPVLGYCVEDFLGFPAVGIAAAASSERPAIPEGSSFLMEYTCGITFHVNFFIQ
jgi:hypothetical protein